MSLVVPVAARYPPAMDPAPSPLPRAPAAGRERHAGIEAARLVLCLAVVLLHALPDLTRPAAIAVAAACRMAVPFFFIAAGAFLRVPARWTSQILTRPARVLALYGVWFVLYIFFFRVHGPGWRPHPTDLLTGGAAFHLWFLPALAVSLMMVASGLALGLPRRTLAAAVLLAAASLAFGSYHQALGLPLLRGTRSLAAPLFVMIGVLLSRRTLRLGLAGALGLLMLAYGLELGEEWLIARLSAAPPTSHDIILSTYLLGIAAFLVARALPPLPAVRWVAKGGRVSLGVYAAHLAILLLLSPRIGGSGLVPAFAAAAATFVVATLGCLLVGQAPLAWRLVTTQPPASRLRAQGG